MELILNNTDLENMIKEFYDGVDSIKFSKEVKVTVSVNPDKIMKKTKKVNIPTVPAEPPKPLTQEDINDRLAQNGGMATGGRDRNLMRF